MDAFSFLCMLMSVGWTLCSDAVSREEFDAVLSELQTLRREFIQLKSECRDRDVLQSSRDKRLEAAEPIAFSVYLSSPTALHVYNQHHVIPFDVKVLDTVNGFQTSNYIYTIQDSGIYVFTWTVVVIYENCAFELVLDSSAIGDTYPDSEHDADNDTATGVVVVRANKGSKVYLRTINPCHHLRSDSRARTSFSGWRL